MAAAITDSGGIFMCVSNIDGDHSAEVIFFSEKTHPAAGFLRSRVADDAEPPCANDARTAERCMLAKHAA
jgi:hypothetical protein